MVSIAETSLDLPTDDKSSSKWKPESLTATTIETTQTKKTEKISWPFVTNVEELLVLHVDIMDPWCKAISFIISRLLLTEKSMHVSGCLFKVFIMESCFYAFSTRTEIHNVLYTA